MQAAAGGHRATPYLLAAVALLSLNLRPALVTIGPELPAIGGALHLSGVELGLVTSLPIFALGLASALAEGLGRRIGWGHGVLAAATAIGAGIALRSSPPPGALYAGAVLIGLGIGLGGVYVPALLKAGGSRRIGALMGLYSSMLTLGAATSVGLTPTISRAFGGDWRATLGFWAYPAFACVLVWLPLRRVDAPPAPERAATPLWRNGLAWAVTANMGLQSMTFYSLTSWLGALLQHDRGLSLEASGVALSAFFLPQLFIALVVPIVLSRSRHQGALAAGCASLSGVGILGTLYGPPAAIPASCFLIGTAMGAVFSIALAFLVLRAGHAQTAARLSGMAQSVGYSVSAIGPLMLGLLRSAPDPLLASTVWLLLLVVGTMAAGFLAGRRATVDDAG